MIPYEFEIGKLRVDRGEMIDKGNLYIDVRHPDFNEGAFADGVRDDGIAFNKAVEHLATQGGTIMVPPGDYLLTTAFTFNSQDNIVLWLMPGVVLTGAALPTATGNNFILDWRSGNIDSSIGSSGGAFTVPITTTDTTQSTSTTTGSVITSGGVGIAKDVFVGGLVDIATTLTVAGIVSVDDTTQSTSGVTGSIHTDGGLGVAKNVVVDGFIGVGGVPLGEFHMLKTDDPLFVMEATGEAANEKIWVWTVDGPTLKGQTKTDVLGVGATWLQVNRQSGTGVVDIIMTATGGSSGITLTAAEVKTTGNFSITTSTAKFKLNGRTTADATGSGTISRYAGNGSGWASYEMGDTGIPGVIKGNFTIDQTLAVTGITTLTAALVVNDVTNSTAITNGSIQTDGGLGVVLDAFIGGNLDVAGTFTQANISTGTGTFSGIVSVDDTTDSTSGITGSIHTDGGLGVLLDLAVGGAVGIGTAPTSSQLVILQAGASANIMRTINSNASPLGIFIDYDSSTPNSTTAQFLLFEDATAKRFEVRSNGGIANFQSNDADLSDERLKQKYGLLDSVWDAHAAIEFWNFKYLDNLDSRMMVGVMAQQLDLVAPALCGHNDWGDGVHHTVHNKDMNVYTARTVQECQARIVELEERLDALA